MKEFEVDNFTAIIPGTCNANCGFCPEKESEQVDKATWLYNLVDNINSTHHMGYDHVSLSGGEPTLDLRMLAATFNVITLATPVKGVGFTTNGQFLESEVKRLNLIQILNSDIGRNVYFINISRHAFDTAENNRIMEVNYRHTLNDIAMFRRSLVNVHSFRLNMVITPDTDYRRLFRETKVLTGWLRDSEISIAFRCDYAFQAGASIPPEILNEFSRQFGDAVNLGGCPTCVSMGPGNPRYRGQVMLKSADFEPMAVDSIVREFIQHMNGRLYYDWTRSELHDVANDPAYTKNWIHRIPTAGELLSYRDPLDVVELQTRTTLPITESVRLVRSDSPHVKTKPDYSNLRCGFPDYNPPSCGGGCGKPSSGSCGGGCG